MSPFEFVASSHLVTAAVAAAVALTLLQVLRREARVRPDAPWVNDHVMAILFAPAITILIATAVVFAIFTLRGWGAQPTSAAELAVAGGAVLIIATVWFRMAPGRDAPVTTDRDDARRLSSATQALVTS
jgi:uncharacterized membrane protein